MSSSNSAATAGRRARVLRGVSAQTVALTVIEGSGSHGNDPEADRRAAERGYTEGFERGYQDGMTEGRAAMAAEVDSARTRLASAARALSAAAADLSRRQAVDLAQLEDVVAGLAYEIAASVVGHEVARSATPAGDALARALALAPPSVAAVARFHPEDVDVLEMAVPLDRPIKVIADPAVERGGCVVEAGDCRIDAQISPALDRVRLALLGEPAVGSL